MAAVDSRKALRKFKFERRVGRTIVNPLVAALDKIGIRAVIDRRVGDHRRQDRPASAGTAHRPCRRHRRLGDLPARQAGRLGAQHHREPTVRVRVGNEWHSGTAAFVPDDDVVARPVASAATSKLGQSATALGMRALQSDPISVRITYTD